MPTAKYHHIFVRRNRGMEEPGLRQTVAIGEVVFKWWQYRPRSCLIIQGVQFVRDKRSIYCIGVATEDVETIGLTVVYRRMTVNT